MKDKAAYVAMIFIQCVYAGMAILSKKTITQGTNPYVFVAYRQALATLALAPFAFYLERKSVARLSFTLLFKIALSSGGITISLNLFYIALSFVSATFATALTNTSPVITFILAVCFRMERLSIREIHGVLKLIGCAISLLGALICTFARGPPMYSQTSHNYFSSSSKQITYSKDDWIKGSLIILAANAIWCLWLIMQVPLIKQYPAKLRLIAMQCLFSSVSSAIWAAAKERSVESWKIKWDIINVVSILYCGLIVTAINNWLQVQVVEKKGPVFTSSFGPLALILTAILSAFLFQETLHWGSVCGTILLVVGLYGILWGKSKEKSVEEIPK